MPLLDHRVFEYPQGLPLRMKICEGQGEWLRGPSRPWAEGLLRRSDLEHVGLDPNAIRRPWTEHLAGKPLATPLWNVLTFRAWVAEQDRNVASCTSALREPQASLR